MLGKASRLWLFIFMVAITIYMWSDVTSYAGFFVGLTGLVVALALFFE
jgi:hypothetical protein